MSKRRVVVTGMGMVTPLGLDVASTWQSILAGKSGVAALTRLNPDDFPVKIAAEVKGFDSSTCLDAKESRKFDLFIQFAVVATAQALQDAGIESNPPNAERIGVAIGSGMGGLSLIEKNLEASFKGGARKIAPSFIPGAIVNMAPGLVSIKFGLRGPNFSAVTACSTGAQNIALAERLIVHGDADIMVTGGAEMATTVLGVGGFSASRTLSRRNDAPEKASRPWDRDRDGFVIGEGSGILVLEEYEHAKARGAHIYAELAGAGMGGDAFHPAAPEPNGVGSVLAMQNALREAELNPDQIGYINPHATSTKLGDTIEVVALKKAFGDAIYNIPVSGTKSMTGHMLGAVGAVEAIFSILALRDQVAPPTINLDNPDEGCDLDFVLNTPREVQIEAALSHSLGFGGTTTSLIFRKL